MQAISELLKNHKIPGVKDAEMRRLCASCAEAVLRYPVKASQVKFKEGTLSFRVPSVVKSELKLRQAELKELLAAAGVTLVALS